MTPQLVLYKGGYHPSRIDKLKELVNESDLISLARQYGLFYILRPGEIEIVGEVSSLIFNKVEKNTCQLKAIY